MRAFTAGFNGVARADANSKFRGWSSSLFLSLSLVLSLFSFHLSVSRKQDNYLRDLQRALCWNAFLVQSGASDARMSPFLLPSMLTLLFPCRARCLHDYLLRLHVNANAAPYSARIYASTREYVRAPTCVCLLSPACALTRVFAAIRERHETRGNI